MSLPSSCPLSTCLTSFRCFRFFRTISLCFFYQHEFLVSTLQTFLSPLPLLIPYVYRIFFRPVSRNILTKLYWDTCTISILLKTQHFYCFFAQISVISVSGIFKSFYKFDSYLEPIWLSCSYTIFQGKVASKWNRADFQDGRPVNLCVSPTSQSRSGIFAYYYRIFHKLTESANK